MVCWVHRPFHEFPHSGWSPNIRITTGTELNIRLQLSFCSLTIKLLKIYDVQMSVWVLHPHLPICRLSRCSQWTSSTLPSSTSLLYLLTSPTTTLSLFIKRTTTSTPYCESKPIKCALPSSHKPRNKLISLPLQSSSGVSVCRSWFSIQPADRRWKYDHSAEPDHCLYRPGSSGNKYTHTNTCVRSIVFCWVVRPTQEKVEKHNNLFYAGSQIVWS